MNKIDGRVHSQVSGLLSAYLDGQVSTGQRAQVEQHLAVCPICTRDLSAIRDTVRLLGKLPPLVAPRSYTLRPEQASPARPAAWRWAFGLPGLATGVAVLLCTVAVGGVALLGRVAPGSVLPVAMAPNAPGAPVAHEQQDANRISAPTSPPWSAEAMANVTSVPAGAGTAPTDNMKAAGRSPTPAAEAARALGEREVPTGTPTTPAASTTSLAVPPVPESFTRPGPEAAAPTTLASEGAGVVQQKAQPGSPEATPTASPGVTPGESPTRPGAPKGAAVPATSLPTPTASGEAAPTAQPEAPAVLEMAPPEELPAPQAPPAADEEDMVQQRAEGTVEPELVAVDALQLEIEPGVIRLSGRLPLPEGQIILAELYREQEPVDWALPETLRSRVEAEGQFEFVLKARPDIPNADLLGMAPAQYEIRIVPVEPEMPIEARVPFDTGPLPQPQ